MSMAMLNCAMRGLSRFSSVELLHGWVLCLRLVVPQMSNTSASNSLQTRCELLGGRPRVRLVTLLGGDDEQNLFDLCDALDARRNWLFGRGL